MHSSDPMRASRTSRTSHAAAQTRTASPVFARRRLLLTGMSGLSFMVAATVLTGALTVSPTANAKDGNGIVVQQASLQADPGSKAGGWTLDARFAFVLNNSLTDAVSKGIPLYFRTEFTLTKPRWYWFDDQEVTVAHSARLAFLPLTREYRVSTSNGVSVSASSLEEALDAIKDISGWHVIDAKQVGVDETYVAAVRMELDISQMPKPFQIDAVNNSDWNLSSDWSRFNFNTVDHEK